MAVLSNVFSSIWLLYSILVCQNRNVDLNKQFDFIVVGGGSAGSVVASRLSENPNVNVLLIEAGDCPPFSSFIPGKALNMDPILYWNYPVTSTTNSMLSFPKPQVFAQGKLLGGGSGVNGMAYVRGNHLDYDYWESLGNDGWGYDDVLPYFLRAEGNTIPAQMTKYHNTTGPLRVSYLPFTTTSQNAFIHSGDDYGYSIVDFNAASQIGFAQTPFTMLNGARSSTFSAYLAPILNRPNLVILTNAQVTKVLINNRGMARGIEYLLNGQTNTINATKEVILSAGALGTPKILMLSGIGNATTLQNLKIPVVADLPGVGQNLHDHVACAALLWKLTCINCTYNLTNKMDPANFKQWLLERNGLMSVPGGFDGVAFIRTKHAETSATQPDVQLFYSSSDIIGVARYYQNSSSSQKGVTYDDIFGNNSVVNIVVSNVHPLSRGFTTINTTDPLQFPISDFRYLSNKQDVEKLVEGIKETLQFINSTSFKEFHPQFNPFILPGCENVKYASDAYWACVVRHVTIGESHPVGTCKMGNSSDPMAVVNSQLQVYKIKKLRVIDNSIMPQITSGNTNAPAIMIGEKASDMIKKYYKI